MMCQWFARCSNKATQIIVHPVLGKLDVCDRCHKFATENSRGYLRWKTHH